MPCCDHDANVDQPFWEADCYNGSPFNRYRHIPALMVPETVCKTALFRAFIAYHLETKLMPILGSMHQEFATSDGATPAVVLRRGTADPTQPSGRSPWRMILLASLGGALELYDFVVFGMFASAIGAAFFPTANPLVSQMLAYTGFAIGYFARPAT
jgi:hypothetical protein